MIRGCLEIYNAWLISGWAAVADGQDPTLRVSVDGRVVAETVPSVARPDIGGRPVGFSVDVSGIALPRVACTVSVTSKATGEHIANSPVMVALADDAARKVVISGSDGWLFRRAGTQPVVREASPVDSPSPEDDAADASVLESWQTFGRALSRLERPGLVAHCLVVPSKERVLRARLPEGLEPSSPRLPSNIARALVATWPGFVERYHFPLASLRHEGAVPTFTRGDALFTWEGAHRAVQVLFRDEFPDEVRELARRVEASERSSRFEHADLLARLGGMCIERKPTTSFRRPRVIHEGRTSAGEPESTRVSGYFLVPRRVPFVHDAFGAPMIPFLAGLFGYVHAVRSTRISRAMIERVGPDVLLVERGEAAAGSAPEVGD